MSELPNTHRIEFDMKLLLTAAPCEYRLISTASETGDGTRKVVGAVGFPLDTGENLVLKCSPWMHSELSKVTIFYRRADPKQGAEIGKLKRILDKYGVAYRINQMGRNSDAS